MAKKLTIEEKKKALEEQLATLEILSDVETEIKEIISNYNSYIDNEMVQTYQNGVEPEQDKTWEGELRWELPDETAKDLNEEDARYLRHVFPESKILEKYATLEEAQAKPYYAPHYDERKVEFGDLSDWSKDRVRKWRKVIELLEGIEIA